MTKLELIDSATSIIGELQSIVDNQTLLRSIEARKENGFTVFTKNCQLQKYWRLFTGLKTFPKQPWRKTNKKHLLARLAFWEKFIDEVNVREWTESKDSNDLQILNAALKADKQAIKLLK